MTNKQNEMQMDLHAMLEEAKHLVQYHRQLNTLSHVKVLATDHGGVLSSLLLELCKNDTIFTRAQFMDLAEEKEVSKEVAKTMFNLITKSLKGFKRASNSAPVMYVADIMEMKESVSRVGLILAIAPNIVAQCDDEVKAQIAEMEKQMLAKQAMMTKPAPKGSKN